MTGHWTTKGQLSQWLGSYLGSLKATLPFRNSTLGNSGRDSGKRCKKGEWGWVKGLPQLGKHRGSGGSSPKESTPGMKGHRRLLQACLACGDYQPQHTQSWEHSSGLCSLLPGPMTPLYWSQLGSPKRSQLHPGCSLGDVTPSPRQVEGVGRPREKPLAVRSMLMIED